MTESSMAQRLGLLMNLLRRGISSVWRAEARFRGVEFGGQVLFNGRPLITRAPGSRLFLGDGVQINSSVRTNPLACSRPGTLRTLLPGAELILEARVGLSSASVCAAKSIRIGEGTFIGADVMIFDTDFHAPMGDWGWSGPEESPARPIVIGRGAFIGARAIVLKGVTIGDRAIVGAGAVVTKDVPPRHFAVGNPAKARPIPAASAP